MQTKIYNLLRDFVAIESISCTRTEREASVFVRDYFAKFPYFRAHNEEEPVRGMSGGQQSADRLGDAGRVEESLVIWLSCLQEVVIVCN